MRNTSEPSQNFTPLENNALDHAAATGGGGVFRLEAMAPGMDNAEAALAAPRKRKVSVQAMALGILLAVGGGMIYGMRLLGIGPLTRLNAISVPDYEVGRPNARLSDHKQILKDLAADHAGSQVQPSDVQKNPFRMADLITAPPSPEAGMPDPGTAQAKAAEDRARKEAEKERQTVHTALASLKVNGILGGANPVARISGEAVRVGDTVADIFTVKAIKGRSVEVQYKDDIYELHMDDDDLNLTHPRKK